MSLSVEHLLQYRSRNSGLAAHDTAYCPCSCRVQKRVLKNSTSHLTTTTSSHRASHHYIPTMILRGYHRPWAALYAFLTACLFSQVFAANQSPIGLERASNQSLLWGPYRPNLYFGVRPRVPKTLLMGLLWASVEDYQSVQTSM